MTWISEHRGALAVALMLVVVAGPVVQEYTAPTAPRYTLAAALVEHRTINLDRYERNVFVDRLIVDGHLYSDKAPGQPFFSVPAYALARAAGGESATVVRIRGNLGVWFVTAWSSLLPALALVLLIYGACRRLGERAALVGAAGVAFGTLLLPYSAQLYGHVLAAAFGFGAWGLVRAPRVRWPRALVAGALTGAAVAVEYQVLIVAVALTIWMLLRHRRQVAAFVVGSLPAVVFLGAYHSALLGSPVAFSYGKKHRSGPLSAGLGVPKPTQALEILFGSRGIFLFTPLIAVGLWGLVRLARSRGTHRYDAWFALAVIGAFFLMQAGWGNPWGGEMPGPRYMIPALPFLGLGIAEMWTVRPRVVVATGAISAFSMFWPLYARHLVPHDGWLIDTQLTDVNLVGFMPTLFTMSMGWAGWLVHFAVVLGALWVLLRALDERARRSSLS